MNMKKTIAAVAAGAMAVSAMATSVAALEDQTLSYNLAAYYTKWNPPSATFQTSFVKVTGPSDLNFIRFSGLTSVGSVTIRIVPDTVGEQTRTYTYSSSKSSLNYNPNLVSGKDGWESYFVFGTELNFLDASHTATVIVTVDTSSWVGGDQAEVNGKIGSGDIAIKGGYNAPSDGVVTPGWSFRDSTNTTLNAYTPMNSTKKVYRAPFKTGPNGNQNIAYYLQNGNIATYTSEVDNGYDYEVPKIDKDGNVEMKDGKPVMEKVHVAKKGTANNVVGGKTRDENNNYQNVLPVLNDAIANYESVTFTFNTAADSIVWTPIGTDDFLSKFYTGDGSDTTYDGSYAAGLTAVGGNANGLMAVYDSRSWGADGSYKSFTQHLYNGTGNIYGVQNGWGGFGGEEYLGFDWAGQNLFGGALVINENLTMSLSDVDYFDWTATTLSFDWDAIMDGAATSNNYATYVQSIKLATSVTWYWDSMEVVLVAGEADDASASAGVTGEEEELGDDLGGDEELFDGGEEPVETPEEPAETPVEIAPVQSPATGNAPVALAVIPVALAAAAIVAKKRG